MSHPRTRLMFLLVCSRLILATAVIAVEVDDSLSFGSHGKMSLEFFISHPPEATSRACIDTSPGHPAKPHLEKPGDINRGKCPPARYRMNDWQRSGRADLVAPWAEPSLAKKYSADYVGGGAALTGRCRRSDEGTWGVDYQFFKRSHIFLKWTCGRSQGGEGAYETDHEKKSVAIRRH